MAHSEGIKALKLFNEKAEKLFQTRYVKYLNETKKLSVTVSAERGKGVTIKKDLPDQDAIDAFVLTFRLFIQKRERSSFKNLGRLYESLPISPVLKNEFAKNRKALNDFLDKKLNITIEGFTPTIRELINIFVYGGLAHSDPQKKAIYDKWKGNEITYSMLEQMFCTTLEMCLRAINNAFILNEKAIKEIEN